MLKILCIGSQWRGADDGTLFKAFARIGNIISIVDDKLYIPSENASTKAKIISRLIKPFMRQEFNDKILSEFDIFGPDIVVVYKGTNIKPQTLIRIKEKNKPIVCIYPDVSMFDHGELIPKCISLYDYIFTTKTFGIKDIKEQFGHQNVGFIPHAFDPEIHRLFDNIGVSNSYFYCHASFIGSYSPKKEQILTDVIHLLPELNLKIWGGHWDSKKNTYLYPNICNARVNGDLYALAIQCSDINIAILSEKGGNASNGDQITSRTFHIPAAGGFMIHERTEEFLQYFTEDVEAVCFSDAMELAEKIKYYLKHIDERKKIAKAGHEMVWKFHKSDNRAELIIEVLKQNGLIPST